MDDVYDPRDPETRADPFPLYRRLRERDPVHWSEPLKGWVLTRYADVRAVLNDGDFSADRITPFADHLTAGKQAALARFGRALGRWAVFLDPPDHTRIRGTMNRAFTARAVDRMAPAVAGIVEGLLDRVAPAGDMDVIADFAYPLPVAVIGHMLGVPQTDLWRLKKWSDELATVVGTAQNTPDKHERAARSWREMSAYFADLIADRRRNPGDDVLSDLIAARDEGALDDQELLSNAILLLFAGHETTTNLIGNGLLALLRHPEALAALRRDPGLVDSAVEELLRYDGPAQAVTRIARVDKTLGDRRIRAGDRVFVMINAANRDPAEFESPDRLDLARRPNRHLAFGYGIHFCLGAPLARLEARTALSALLRRMPDLALAAERPEWIDSLVFRGLRALPVRFTPASPTAASA